MGSGGYKTSMPGWDKKDTNLIARGIIPTTQQLPGRARSWFSGHGENVDEQTGELIAPLLLLNTRTNL
jgi:hypothetical protein